MPTDNLKPIERSFVNTYLSNGFNGTRAYLSIRPRVTYASATVQAANLLGKHSVKQAIEDKQESKYDASVASRGYLIQEAHDIGRKALSRNKHSTALNAVDVKARLNGVYDKGQEDMTNYTTLMQSLVVNVNVSGDKDQNDTPVIDTEIVPNE